eukprot:scaffold62023_cov19-Tisochrysis_lutea.AAC.3
MLGCGAHLGTSPDTAAAAVATGVNDGQRTSCSEGTQHAGAEGRNQSARVGLGEGGQSRPSKVQRLDWTTVGSSRTQQQQQQPGTHRGVAEMPDQILVLTPVKSTAFSRG